MTNKSKTRRIKLHGKHKTQRNHKQKIVKSCEVQIGLKPFAKDFDKKMVKKLKESNEEIKRNFVKNLMSQYSPRGIKPNNDFYDHINYTWLKNVSLTSSQKYITQIDDFRLAQDKVYGQLNELILDYIKHNDNKLSKELKSFYNSVIRMNNKEHSKKLSKEIFHKIKELRKDKNNIWKMLALANKSEVIRSYAPFVWSLNPDNKQSSIGRCYLDPHTFYLLDTSVYFDDGTEVKYKQDIRNNFKHLCKKVFDIALGPNHGLKPECVFEVEQELINSFVCNEGTNSTSTYNKINTIESMTKYDFNWKEFAKELGFSYTPPFYITSNENYLKCGTEVMLKNWNSDKWLSYWVFLFLKPICRMTSGWENIIYDYFGRYERGQEAINTSNAVSATLYLSIPFNKFLTDQYVAKYENAASLKYVEVLCNDLKETFLKMMRRNTWLSPSTKKYALLKLKHLHFDIATPKILREDPLLNYGESIIENMNKIFEWRHEQSLQLEGKEAVDIPIMDWTQYPVKMTGRQAYIVNASYTPSKNGIYINLGYIQKPFLDLDERGIEYNLAHLGFTIGHEMSHGFDDWGSQYDYHGNLNDWWTPSDKKKFKEIQADVINQYEVFAARDGIKFDASIGIGEDLADISGLAICDKYLRDNQWHNNDIIPIQNISFEAFYVFYAYQQKQQVSKKALAAQLKTNPHPLDKYRCNVPLSRSLVFRAIYDVSKDDGMWWHNTNTVW